MAREKFRDKPFYYKFFCTVLRIASGIVIMLVIFFAMRFLLETPMYRMFDGISVPQMIMMALVLVAVICLFIAWKNAFSGGIATLFPIIAYTLIESIENGAYTAAAVNYIMLALALLFVAQGILKKHLEYDRVEDIMGPKIDKNEGPDLTNLNL